MGRKRSGRKRSSRPGKARSESSNSTSKSLSAYDPNFRQKLVDSGIYLPNRNSKPTNLDDIKDHLLQRRPSLSPSQFLDADFEHFAELEGNSWGESSVMADVFKIIEGKGREDYFSGGPDHRLNHLEPLSAYLPQPQPHTYDGALPQKIDRRVRQTLGRHIVPCTESSRPAAPNFFVEGKSVRERG